ncbi:MAG TPA: hypothetical protein VFZ09_02875 [Archangium sp.]|uniref:hypothetical protein n=1 Tax=Archangium sp. TaxID=1872627 RepID=UPI002E31F2EE|nr:hypothetical protein [Archangium sp.]HEX5745157.1 hypothetical protein [Archangium sp.]
MKAMRVCVVAVAGMLLGLPLGVVGSVSTEPVPPGVTCEPGTRDCGARQGEETVPQSAGLESQHPCDWVETCQLPCGREGGECCHAEWNCPPDANLPRC